MTRLYLFILIFLGITPAALAETVNQYCVSCQNPSKTYLCKITSASPGAQASAMQLNCAVNIAKDYNHESCAVKTGKTANCNGLAVTYANTLDSQNYSARDNEQNNFSILPPADRPEKPSQSKTHSYPARGQDSPRPKQKDKEPKTLVDLTNKAIKDTGESIDNAGDAIKDSAAKAGDAISNAAKTTYECLTSLFRDCH